MNKIWIESIRGEKWKWNWKKNKICRVVNKHFLINGSLCLMFYCQNIYTLFYWKNVNDFRNWLRVRSMCVLRLATQNGINMQRGIAVELCVREVLLQCVTAFFVVVVCSTNGNCYTKSQTENIIRSADHSIIESMRHWLKFPSRSAQAFRRSVRYFICSQLVSGA